MENKASLHPTTRDRNNGTFMARVSKCGLRSNSIMKRRLSEGQAARTERWKQKGGNVEFLVPSEWRLMCPCAVSLGGATNLNNSSGKVPFDRNAFVMMWEKFVDECFFFGSRRSGLPIKGEGSLRRKCWVSLAAQQ